MIAAADPTLLMIGQLSLQLVTVERQRRIAARQEGRARESLTYIQQRGAALLQQGGEAVPRLGKGLKRADRLVRALSKTDSPEAIAEAGRLAQRLQDADLAGRVEIISRAVRALVDIARETGSDVDVLKTRTVGFQHRTLRIQRELLSILQESLAIQRETLDRVRSIDERTAALQPTAAVP